MITVGSTGEAIKKWLFLWQRNVKKEGVKAIKTQIKLPLVIDKT